MAFKTLFTTRFLKPYPPTSLLARFASHLNLPGRIGSPHSSDSNESEAPIPKVCPLTNPFLMRRRVVPYMLRDGEDSFLAIVDFPGISKEDLKIRAETHCLRIIAEEKLDEYDREEEGGPREYNGSIAMPAGVRYKMDQIHAEMKNGVLKLVIPKIKLEERDDITMVTIQND